MTYYTDGDIIEVISLEGDYTNLSKVSIGDRLLAYSVDIYNRHIKVSAQGKYVDFMDVKVVQSAPETQYTMEQRVAQRAIQNYQQAQMDNLRIEQILSTKTYHLNDYVMDVRFGVGKIVGWDEEHNYYRVRFNDWMKFVGREEEILMPYEWDDVPKELADYDPSVINYVWGFYLDDTEAEDTEA